MDTANATPYRAPTLRAPRAPSVDDLVEVTVTWGDQVLSVAHLKPGEGFAWEGARVLTWREGRWLVTPPAGATGWTLRPGDASVEALRDGGEHALDADDRAGVLLGEVAVRAARTTAPEALPRTQGARRFAAWTAGLMVLAATGLATAQGEDDDGTLAWDDTAERAWIAARLRPYTEHAPPRTPQSQLQLEIVCSGCSCTWMDPRETPGDPFGLPQVMPYLPPWEAAPPARRLEGAYARSVRLAAVEVTHGALADNVRRVVLRNVGQLSFCRQGARDLARPGRAVMRFVVGPTGAVMGAGVASATAGPDTMVDCFANALRRWQFAETPRGEAVVATVTLSVR